MIRDLSDSYDLKKNLLREKDENLRLNIIQNDLDYVFNQQVAVVDHLLDTEDNTHSSKVKLKALTQNIFCLFC
jgi:hypothetical protein